MLLILAYHIGGVTWFPNTMHGDLGVDVFLLLSGAALAFSHHPEEGSGRFLGRRLIRLLPAYWIVLTIYWLGGVHILGRVHTNTDVISHYLCIHPWWGDKYFLGINDSFWFLGLIVPLYLVFAAMRHQLDARLDRVLGIGLILSFILTLLTFFWLGQPSVFVHLGLRPPIFFIGIVFGQMLRTGEARLTLTPWLGLGVLLSLYGLFVTGTLVGYTMAGFSIFVAYVAMRTNAESVGNRLPCRSLSWVGIYSYEIFLIHQPLVRDYNHWVWTRILGRAPDQVHLAIGVVMALVVTLFLSAGLHHFTRFIGRKLDPARR